MVEITKVEQKKKKNVFKLRLVQETSGATSSILAFTLQDPRKRKGQRLYLKK